MTSRYLALRAQRDWRRKVISRLKHRLGLWCRGCESPDALALERDEKFLELVIPNRQGSDLAAYKNNTVTIYNHILKGKLPLDRITLLCDECRFKFRQEQNDRNS